MLKPAVTSANAPVVHPRSDINAFELTGRASDGLGEVSGFQHMVYISAVSLGISYLLE